jgi:gag-polypeptide of LTR copia-type
VSNSNGKISFGMIKICKSKGFEDGKAALAWEKFNKKYDPISDTSLVKTERMFRESRPENNEDPEIWINNIEDLRIKLETIGSSMIDDHFIVQVLNSLTGHYKLQMFLLEKQIESKDKPLSIEDVKKNSTYNLKDFPQIKMTVLARKMPFSLRNSEANARIVANLAIGQRNVSQSTLDMKK